ncbi:endopolyphosphatase [Pluteus cervinus]|uniref:Endopolyphosphatase n=1 Tax=Pluteus cervinus TaxID=181527 RepID=A0ACD3BDG1_9AGAR|nr:endopolyphosphatase [Pluteus cervinus]
MVPSYQLCLLAALLHLTDASPAQTPLQISPFSKPRRLNGRFLQISDMHPDPHYKPSSSVNKACHRKKPKKRREEAGYYGTPYSECDSPFVLTNYTLDFLEKKWASELDFVIWTGDNARHDNDRKLPRTPAEIYDLNRAVAKRMEEIFLSRGIPVVPSLGPNGITYEFSQIWKKFIPFHNHQVFQRGAYYSVEVIPNEVAVIALNTMYFYDSNKAVGGCLFKEPDDPGNLQFDWLGVQLKSYRNRGLHIDNQKLGHVPPSPGNYFPECYVRYAELALRFQDTILGHLFGHMNADHFFFLEAIDLDIFPEEEDETNSEAKEELYQTLLGEFSALPRANKNHTLDEYAVVNVSPPVVPNPYLPTFRIFSYNVTGFDGASGVTVQGKKRQHGHRRGNSGDKEVHCKTERYQDSWKCHLNETWHSDPKSPSRTNTLWSPLGYAQYYLPNLKDANEEQKPAYELEYMTFQPALLHPEAADGGSGEIFWYPIPLQQLPRSLRNSSVTESKFAPYAMADLTVGSWLELGRRLGDKTETALRKKFRKYMYLGGSEGK